MVAELRSSLTMLGLEKHSELRLLASCRFREASTRARSRARKYCSGKSIIAEDVYHHTRQGPHSASRRAELRMRRARIHQHWEWTSTDICSIDKNAHQYLSSMVWHLLNSSTERTHQAGHLSTRLGIVQRKSMVQTWRIVISWAEKVRQLSTAKIRGKSWF